MNRVTLGFVGILMFAMACFGQTTSTDSQTLQTLLLEVRQLRSELRTTAITAQKSQVLVSRIQGQEMLVERSRNRLDEAKAQHTKTEEQRRQIATDIKQNEDFMNNPENPADQRKGLESAAVEFKTRLAAMDLEEQERQRQVIEAEQQFRLDESRLNELRAELERLDKALEQAGQP